MLLQEVRFGRVLQQMEERAGRAHRVNGDLAIAGKLTKDHITGRRVGAGHPVTYPDGIRPDVLVSDTATIQSGAYVIRTELGSVAYKRTHTDQYVYIPFRSGRTHNACVMCIEQLVLVKRVGMGWRNDEARIAVGTLWDHLSVRHGAGLESTFNDDPKQGACVIPRAMLLTPQRKEKGYKHAVFIRQIQCPCVYIPDSKGGDVFMTISKMGYRGRKDLLWGIDCGQPTEDVEIDR